MEDTYVTDTRELSTMNKGIKSSYNGICSRYTSNTASIMRQMESIISKYDEYSDVKSTATQIILILLEIQKNTSLIGNSMGLIVDGLKTAINMYKESEKASTNLLKEISKITIARIASKIFMKTISLRTADALLAKKKAEIDEKENTLVDIFNDIAVSGKVDYSFEVFGNKVTLYSEVYSDYSTVTIGTGVGEDGKITSTGTNFYPSTEGDLKGQLDIAGDGKISGSVGIKDEIGKSTMWLDSKGKLSVVYRKNIGDNFAQTSKTYVNMQQGILGKDVSIDTRGKNYDRGMWSKIGVKVEKTIPDSTQVQEQEMEEGIRSTWTCVTNCFEDANEWVGEAKEYAELVGEGIAITFGNMAEGIGNAVSDAADWVVEHPAETVGGIVIAGCIIAIPFTGGASAAGVLI